MIRAKKSIFELSQRIGENVLTALVKVPIIKKIVKSQFRLKSFVWAAVLIASFISFSATYLVVSSIYRHSFIANADEVSNAVSRQLFSSMVQLMEKGWTRDELNVFLDSVKGARAQFPYIVEIFRGKPVERDYGKIEQPALGRNIVDSFETGDTITFKADPIIINIYPIKAEDSCLRCHVHANVGEVLGVMKISQDISPAINEAQRKFNVFFFILLPIPFVMAGIIALILTEKIRRSTAFFHERVSEINSVKDLTKLNNLDSVETGFAEFNAILLEFGVFAKRIKNVAVDREVLEFELRVLERFIITSAVVKDWKEHVMHLLVEINKVVKAHALFSIIQVDEEISDLDIFWIHSPSKQLQEHVERIVRLKITSENERFRGLTTLTINHAVADSSRALEDLSEENVDLLVKSIILQNPRMAGVVGIAVRADMTRDAIRSLIIDSILTTLVNVIGSIKAIYKYTKDLEYYATRDPLTKLYNQRLFWELLSYEIERSQRHNERFSLLVIDLDNFKNINDFYGHIFGDNFLAGIADTIRNGLRSGDILARYGGDEFVVVLSDADEEQAYFVATKIQEDIKRFSLASQSGTNVKVTVSIGFAVYPVHAEGAKDLFLFADNMMYKAKRAGRNTILIPTEEDVTDIFKATGEKTAIVMKAIEEKTLIPYFQPIINMETGNVEGHEVLSRIKTDKGILDAVEFTDIAEQLGVVNKIDFIVMEKVFRKVKNEGYEGSLFFNLTPKSLINKEFLPSVLKLTSKYEIGHKTIAFEIAEKDTVKNISLLGKFVHELTFEGFRFAIDDFGSGFSSFHYIKLFPIDLLKIKGDFIKSMIGDKKDLAFVRTMAVLAREFGIQTVAQRIEDETILAAVKQIGINYGQGHHIGRPAPELVR
jgi:diguanylate cyclase (GGDEF)-like protein